MDFLPEIINEALENEEEGQNWRQDKLHVSSDLLGCTRRACLEMSEFADKAETDLYGKIRRKIGRGMHSFVGRYLKERYDVKTEVDVSRGLPEGWAGTADFIVKDAASGEIAVYDLKVVSSSAKYYSDIAAQYYQVTNKQSSQLPLEDHKWQVSSYCYALKKMGIPATRAFVCYLFIDNYFHFGTKYQYRPTEYEVDLVSDEDLEKRFKEVSGRVERWKKTSVLPDYLEPEQKLKAIPNWRKPEKYVLEQRIDWRCKACPFYPRFCHPNQFEGKVGQFEFDYSTGSYVYTDLSGGEANPLVFPPGVEKDRVKGLPKNI